MTIKWVKSVALSEGDKLTKDDMRNSRQLSSVDPTHIRITEL